MVLAKQEIKCIFAFSSIVGGRLERVATELQTITKKTRKTVNARFHSMVSDLPCMTRMKQVMTDVFAILVPCNKCLIVKFCYFCKG